MPDAGNLRVGCNLAAHTLFSWCASCQGVLLAAEVVAWRTWASENVPEVRRAVIAQWTSADQQYWQPPGSHPGMRQ